MILTHKGNKLIPIVQNGRKVKALEVNVYAKGRKTIIYTPPTPDPDFIVESITPNTGSYDTLSSIYIVFSDPVDFATCSKNNIKFTKV